MAEKLFEGQQLDEVTQKIVDEMATDAAKAEVLKPKEESKTDEIPAKPEEKPKEEAKESELESKIILDDEEEEEEEKPSRSGKFVPLSKLQKEKQKRRELEAELQEYRKVNPEKIQQNVSEKPKEGNDEFAKSIESEFGIDAKVVDKILNYAVTLSSQKSKLPDEVIKQIQEFQEQKEEQQSEAVFNREFETIRKNPEYSEVDKDKLYKLAHTDGKIEIDGVKYPIKTVPLRVLIEVAGLKPVRKKTAEASRGGSRATEIKDYQGMSLEELAQLPPKEFLEASNQLAKKKSAF